MIVKNLLNSKDIKIKDGIITEIGDFLEDTEIYDAQNLAVFPLSIDLNVKNSESISKLNDKALKGGVGTILMIPNEKPIYNKLQLAYNLTKEKNIDLLVAIEAIHNNKLTNIDILLDKGANAIFLNSDENMNLIKRVFQYAQMLNVPIFINSNNRNLIGNGQMHDSRLSYNMGLEGINSYVESIEVAKILEFSKYFDVKIVFQSITTKESLKLLENRDTNIFVDVCIDNLLYDDENLEDFNTYYKTFPPLRNKEDKEILLDFIRNGKIDFISSNHIAVSDENKDVPFEIAKNGISKLYLFSQAVYSLNIDEKIVTKMVSSNPAKLFGLNEGEIKVGNKAKFMLVEKNEKFKCLDTNNSIKPYSFSEYKLNIKKVFIF